VPRLFSLAGKGVPPL
jgi:hypothetical protein